MKKDISMSNIPSLNVNEVVSMLSGAYIRLIEQRLPVKRMPAVMLWGPPGVGKSQAVRQIAKKIEEKTGKNTAVTDVRLLLFSPIDLRGIPTANADKTLAVWLKPQIFQMDESDDTVNILFLDEISAAPPSVQAAAYQITLDRVIGEHKLPENCIVIAAGNRVADRSVANRMPKALANRLMHIEIETSVKSWRKWAGEAGIHPDIIAFIKQRGDALLVTDVPSENPAYATPRSWEMVSNILNYIEPDIDRAYLMVSALIGNDMASELRIWMKNNKMLPDMEDIFDGKCDYLPASADAMYATISGMIAYAGEHRDETDRIRNSIIYGYRLPPDYSVALMKGYMGIDEEFKAGLMKIPEYSRWMERKGKLLIGVV